jgi:hypothetical protein
LRSGDAQAEGLLVKRAPRCEDCAHTILSYNSCCSCSTGRRRSWHGTAILARHGVRIERSTLAQWVGAAAAELEPLYNHLVSELKRSSKLIADETRCPVLDPGRGKTKSGYLWAIARDDRPRGGTQPPAVAYRYAPGRGEEHAVAPLEGFSGVLQVDGYAAYNELTRAGGAVTLR